MQPDQAHILIVDDRPDKLLSLTAVLSELGHKIVTANSGRAALRCLLEQDFAIILLDVNMPGIDGFETARLIRQRKNSQYTPIIFITAFGDDMHIARGYELGAVDYILAPIVPEVLKTKVSVFLDLFRRTAEVRQQAERLRHRAAQLHRLTEASIAISSAPTIDRMLRVVTDSARQIIDCHQAATLLTGDQHDLKPRTVVSLSAERLQLKPKERPAERVDIHSLVSRLHTPVQLSRQDLELHPLELLLRSSMSELPEGGCLAAPMTGRDGRNLGLIEVADKIDNAFTEDDKAILVQLAQMAAVALENIVFAEAREANRIKDEFLATLSHELRTPLTAILGWAQLLRTEALGPEEVSNGLEIIERNVLVQTKLIEDLLDVSRIITGKLRLNMRPMSLVAVIRSAIDVILPAAEAKGIRVETEFVDPVDQISGDPDRLQQVLWNLLSNAIKFTPEGGTVSIRLESRNSRVQVQVRDSGDGIATEFLPYVFDRFRQADATSTRAHSGLGIGLAIVRHVVELHGGSVQAQSEGRGRGATFVFDLPISPVVGFIPSEVDEKPSLESPSRPAKVEDLQGLRVLVIDDEPDARTVLSMVLKRYHADVMLAASAREGLEQLAQFKPDVLISDIGMPIQDGYDLIRQVRRRGAEEGGCVPAIALTAFAREEDRSRVLAAGFQVHAIKPIVPHELVAMVAQLAGRSSEPSGSSADGNGSHTDQSAGERGALAPR